MPNVVCAVKQYNQVLCIGKAQHHRKSIEIERLARIKKEREKQHLGMLIGTRIQYLILYTEHFNFLCVNFYVWNFSASHSIRSFDLASSLWIHLHTAIRFHGKQKWFFMHLHIWCFHTSNLHRTYFSLSILVWSMCFFLSVCMKNRLTAIQSMIIIILNLSSGSQRFSIGIFFSSLHLICCFCCTLECCSESL